MKLLRLDLIQKTGIIAVFLPVLRLFEDFLSLIYPPLCLCCNETLPYAERFLCLECRLLLPATGHHLLPDNELLQKFAARAPIISAAALYYFTPNGRAQQLVHQIKYKGQWEAAEEIGRMYGEQLKRSPSFQDIDVIVPVPMHYKKQRLRGFNQAECFAKGLAEVMNVKMNTTALQKIRKTESQTKKNRLERLQNQEETFALLNPDALRGKHILIADDVVTTGSTLEACAEAVYKKFPDAKISLVALAATKH